MKRGNIRLIFKQLYLAMFILNFKSHDSLKPFPKKKQG